MGMNTKELVRKDYLERLYEMSSILLFTYLNLENNVGTVIVKTLVLSSTRVPRYHIHGFELGLRLTR